MKPEDRLQIASANYIKLQHPNALFFHVPNGGSRNKIEAAKLKRMGTLPGVSDILILDQNKGYSGLAIELKANYVNAKGRKVVGKASPSQIEFMERAKSIGYYVAICDNLDAVIELVDWYLG